MKIILLRDLGFKNTITILDSTEELNRLEKVIGRKKLQIGLRMAIDEESQSAYYTSRLGIRYNEIIHFYNKRIKPRKNLELKMLHFFVDSGIKDTIYYWGEFQKALKLYVDLKRQCNTLDSLDLGGGFPIRNHLGFEYD
jgi:arginine decarboxylase